MRVSDNQRLCPLLAIASNSHMPPRCQKSGCAWWREYAGECAISLMVDMFADSDMCRTVFNRQNERAQQ